MNVKNNPLLRTHFIILFTIVVLLISSTANFPEPRDSVKTVDPLKIYAVYPSKHPEKLDFAGERVPMEHFDIYESLDRELLVNQYWQSQTLLFIKRANRFFPVIEPILRKYDIPDDFKFLPLAESGLTNVISPAGAHGIWQFLASTGKDCGLEINDEVDERYHLEKSTEAACKFLMESYKLYGSWTMAAASYNAGRAGINRQIGRQEEKNYYDLLLNEETARYIFRILAFKMILSNPEDYGFFLKEKDLYPAIPYYEVTIDGEVRNFAEFAKRYGISYKILKYMNPWLRDTKLTNRSGKTYFIKIPRKGFFKYSEPDLNFSFPENTSD